MDWRSILYSFAAENTEAMKSIYTVDSLFKEIQSICNDIIENKKTMFSIVESMMILDVDYHNIQVMKGLEKIGFYSFTPEEQMYMLLNINSIYLGGLEPMDFGVFSKLKIGAELKKGKNGLLERGLLRSVAYDSDTAERATTRKERTLLSPDAFGDIFYGMTDIVSYDRIAKQVEVIKPVSIRSRELFFEQENLLEVERLRKLLNPERFNSIMERLKENGRRPAASCLFYGVPGTGKTELAKQLAKETGRDIMIADVAKLHSSFTGDTEKNYREMFNSYRYISMILPKAPILLLNEADGILGKRGDVMRQAIDKIANRVQNLLLQELEDFEGILIATTNLADNLDPAFERRLLYKIEFLKPGIQVREKIWKSMIPDMDPQEIQILAERYTFSGGQISNIATKRDIDYAIDGKAPGYEQMLMYCETESLQKAKESKRIGFR